MHACMHACTRACMYTLCVLYIRMYNFLCVCSYVCVSMYNFLCVCSYVCVSRGMSVCVCRGGGGGGGGVVAQDPRRPGEREPRCVARDDIRRSRPGGSRYVLRCECARYARARADKCDILCARATGCTEGSPTHTELCAWLKQSMVPPPPPPPPAVPPPPPPPPPPPRARV